VFKVVTATAGLEEGKIDESTIIEDTGEIVIDEYRYGNWLFDDLGRTDGQLNVVKAIKRSNDIYFYKVGEYVGPDKLADWARLFGYEDDAGLGDLGAVTGLIPDPEWKEKYKGEKWFLGNTYHMSIGQGDVLVAPIQVNRMMGAIAAKGSLCDPKLVMSDVGGDSCTQMNLDIGTIDLITEGLKEACRPGGTASVFNSFYPEVACKTGTAEHTSKEDLPHAWFTVFAPAGAPEIVLTVMVENAGQGSTEAAPIAKKALEYWFSR
jgi:penicillin-binding protein 2